MALWSDRLRVIWLVPEQKFRDQLHDGLLSQMITTRMDGRNHDGASIRFRPIAKIDVLAQQGQMIRARDLSMAHE
jgi:hypothetical protein